MYFCLLEINSENNYGGGYGDEEKNRTKKEKYCKKTVHMGTTIVQLSKHRNTESLGHVSKKINQILHTETCAWIVCG